MNITIKKSCLSKQEVYFGQTRYLNRFLHLGNWKWFQCVKLFLYTYFKTFCLFKTSIQDILKSDTRMKHLRCCLMCVCGVLMLQPFFCVFFVLMLLFSKIFGAIHFTEQKLPFVVFYVKNLEICLCFQKCSVCKQSLQWGCITGLVAGVYSGMTYGM